MKKILSLVGVAIAAAFITGCTTVQHVITYPDGSSVTNSTSQLDPVRTSNAIKNILPTAVVLAVSQEPASRGYIQKVQVAVCATAAAGKFSPDELKAAIAATNIKEIQTPEVQAAIQAIYGIYSAYYSDVVAAKLNQSAWLVPVLNSICEGLTDGLAATVPAPTNAKVIFAPINTTVPHTGPSTLTP